MITDAEDRYQGYSSDRLPVLVQPESSRPLRPACLWHCTRCNRTFSCERSRDSLALFLRCRLIYAILKKRAHVISQLFPFIILLLIKQNETFYVCVSALFAVGWKAAANKQHGARFVLSASVLLLSVSGIGTSSCRKRIRQSHQAPS
jgi:hypothetical protein